ncbi:ABC transporter permease [Phytoactinopolyspora limicola]|uniref:ABC transporter permease n=1 Tax=Phytoactinopolyspora limicola TaxID=2715536 RepID=UPI00140DD3BB|nr:FtsX-like permease family protein [Phytoactinopolyspora limicola]
MRLAFTALRQAGGSAAVFACLLSAAALFVVCGTILESGVSSPVEPRRYGAADVVVGGATHVQLHTGDASKRAALAQPAPLSKQVAEDVHRRAAETGVKAIPDHASPAVLLIGDRHDVTVHNWSATHLGDRMITDGSAPGPGEMALDDLAADATGAVTGDIVPVRTAHGVQTLRVSGIISYGPTAASMTPAAYLPDDAAARLTDRGDGPVATAIGLVADNTVNADALAADIHESIGDEALARVTSGAGRAQVEFPTVAQARTDLQSLGGSLLGIVVIVTIVVIGAAMTTTAHRRRHTLSLLRTIALTPRDLLVAVAADTLFISAIAAAIGVFFGALVVRGFGGLLAFIGVLPPGYTLSSGPITLAGSGLLTITLAQVIAWAVHRRIAQGAPGAADLSTSASFTLSRPAAVAGAVLTAVGGAASVLPLVWSGIAAVAIAGGGGLLLAFGSGILSRPVVAAVIRRIGRLRLRRRGSSRCPETWLSGATMYESAPRLAAAAAPLILATALALVQVAIPATLASGNKRAAEQSVTASHAVTSAAGLPSVNPPADTLMVTRQHILGWTTVLDSIEQFDLTAYGFAGPVSSALDISATHGNWEPDTPLGADEAVGSEFTAATLGATVGESVDIVLADGTLAAPTVVATVDNRNAVGDIFLSYDLLGAHRAGGSPGAQAADFALTSAIADLDDDLTVRPAAAAFSGGSSPARAVITSVLPLIALFVYIAISAGNTLAQSTFSRATEIRTMHVIGVSRDQLRSVINAETTIFAGITAALGILVALPCLTTISLSVTGQPIPAVPLWFYAVLIASVGGLAMLSITIPGRIMISRNAATGRR